MRVFVIQSGSGDPTWSHTVKIEQGVQSFTLDYKGTLQEAQWYAEQFKTALDAHTEEAIQAAYAHGTGISLADLTPVNDSPAATLSTSVEPIDNPPAQIDNLSTNPETGAVGTAVATEASDVPAAQ
jgi:hypothetical protein